MRWLPAISCLAVVACKPLDEGAREHFARAYSCPDDRVQVQARPDLKYSQLLAAKAGGATPPDEVKRDPERLAKWKSDHTEQHAGLDRMEVFAVTGCEHAVLLACAHPIDGRDGAELVGQTACVEAPAEK